MNEKYIQGSCHYTKFYVIYSQKNIHSTDRQTLKYLMATMSTMVPGKQNLSKKIYMYENRNTCSKVIAERPYI